MNQEIYILIAKHFAGDANEAEALLLQQWLEADEANRQEFAAMHVLWEAEPADMPAVNVDAAWNKVDAAIRSGQKSSPLVSATKVVGMRRWIRYAAAAMVVVAMGLAFFILKDRFWGDAWKELIAAADNQTVQLADGSTVYLRQGAKLRYPATFTQGKRKVALEGEAFFDIQRDTAKPFVIDATKAEVQVLGTSFTVNTNDSNRIAVIVKTGKVQLRSKADAAQSAILLPGDKGLMSGGQVEKTTNGNPNFMYWQNGTLVFNNTPMPEVIELLQQKYHIRIEVAAAEKEKIGATYINGQYTNETIDEVIREIEMISSLRFTRKSDNSYRLQLK
jgi:transmembrane sensor